MRDLDTIRRMELEDWNRNAAFYRDDADSPLMRHLAARRDALYALKPGERVLDLGCGTGATVARLRAQGIQAVGVDSSPEMIRTANELHGLGKRPENGTVERAVPARWSEGAVVLAESTIPLPDGRGWERVAAPELDESVICADATDLPFEDHRFDVVIADGVLHHLAVQGRLITALREVRRVLKPGGRLCIFDRNGSLVSAMLLRGAIAAKTLLGLLTGYRHYPSSATRNEIPYGGLGDRRLLKRHGYTPLRSRPVASAPFFISVVLLNAMQYFLSRRMRRTLEIPIARMVSWIDDRCAWSALCVEQISVWERVAPRLPQHTMDAHKLGAMIALERPQVLTARHSKPSSEVKRPLPVLHPGEVL